QSFDAASGTHPAAWGRLRTVPHNCLKSGQIRPLERSSQNFHIADTGTISPRAERIVAGGCIATRSGNLSARSIAWWYLPKSDTYRRVNCPRYSMARAGEGSGAQWVSVFSRRGVRAAGVPVFPLLTAGGAGVVFSPSPLGGSRYENYNYASCRPVVGRPTGVLATRNRRTC